MPKDGWDSSTAEDEVVSLRDALPHSLPRFSRGYPMVHVSAVLPLASTEGFS